MSSSSSSSLFLPSSSPPPSLLQQSYSPSSSSPALVGGGRGGEAGAGYIEHVVSKFDTLAGVAIKYGVEVADIKKMNGLVTDRQMFALRFLQIPLPGRHPPSPCLSNGQCLALRPKAANRTALGTDVEAGGMNPIPVGLGDSFITDGLSGVRKSSSTSNLQDHDSSSSAFIWSTSKWSLKPDLQAFSTAAIRKPIFDGLPKPITGRRKAALD
ncbi:Peptidoglycan-binding lysin domain [Prunus yedoensis var. nudiflora]|uniref:Peptidoglycan-binding lysin domain n=1 Tax=Prunus yedoensis var. nudiflora TaxID=2094558 RepID=A0A314YJZ2_PRUYE|nr:Peptidoglycan-binding lysin domain [Prunus yedoensis var. nudiflora]PQQ14298.1 Peptidoglycan-binding lysin domain [Prunus yedoensis var. nudiflora]